MTDTEWGEFWKNLDDLYPGKLNPAQATMWKAKVIDLPFMEAHGALTDYYSGEKRPKDGPMPSICGFMRKVRSQSEEKAMRTVPKEAMPWWEIVRAAWKHNDPSKADEYAAMNREEILELHYYTEYLEAVRVYGKHARATATSYWRWQAHGYCMGKRDTYPGRPQPDVKKWLAKVGWSWGAHVRYLEETNEHEEAKRVKAEYKSLAPVAPGGDHSHRLPAPSVPVPQP